MLISQGTWLLPSWPIPRKRDHCRRDVFFSWLVFVLLGTGSFGGVGQEIPPNERATAWLADISLPSKNLVRDGSFESGGEGWGWFQHKAGGLDTVVAANGKTSFRMGVNDPNRHFYYQQFNVPLVPGKTYTLSAMVKAEGLVTLPSDAMMIGVLFLINAGWTESASLKAPRGTYDWTSVTETFIAPPTSLRADGKPTYALTMYWPPKYAGQFWLDDIQIEEGAAATDYTDLYVGPALIAVETLNVLAQDVFSFEEALARFGDDAIIRGLTLKLKDILARAAAVRDDLKHFDQRTKAVRETLVERIDGLARELAAARTLIWTGPAHIPLRDVRLPVQQPGAQVIAVTCLKGEHRDVGIQIANMSPSGYALRVNASPLLNQRFALNVPSSQWCTFYSVPWIRGFSDPTAVFTDVLPRVGRGGLIQVAPLAISQTILSVDTTGLVPGDYVGEISLASLVDASNHQTIPVQVKVLPVAVRPLHGVDIAECFGHTEYAWDAMLQLGVNTFDVNTAWIDADFSVDGNLTRIDFTRVDRNIQRALGDVNDARFLIVSGQGLVSKIRARMAWPAADPRIEMAFKGWVKALADHFRNLGVTADRLIMETYDEPGPGDYAMGMAMAEWIHHVEAAIRTHFYVTGIEDDEAWRQNVRAHDIIGPIFSACTPDNMALIKALGKKLWIYDCQADGETLHPIAYYRLMPWTCRLYGISGWGHFSWFNSSHGQARGYQPWMGVETQNLVYPDEVGGGMVLSRRFLAMRAGTEDYQVLDALERASAAAATAKSQRAESATAFITTACERALQLAPRTKGYHKGISGDVPADLLDRLREQAVGRIEKILPQAAEFKTTLVAGEDTFALSLRAPSEGSVCVRYLINGRLPWHVQTESVGPGERSIVLRRGGEVTRCLAEFTSESGEVLVGSPLIIPQITVDSTHVGYSVLPLNDGLRVEAVQFEREHAWISSADAIEHWVEMDLGTFSEVSAVHLFWMTFTGLPQKTMVQYLDRFRAWKPVSATPTWRPAAGPVERITFDPVTTDKVRILMAANGGGAGGPTLMGLSEVDVR